MGLHVPHPGIKPDPRRDFLTSAELTSFRASREAGTVSFFRCAICKGKRKSGDDVVAACTVEIPSAKSFCSAACRSSVVANPPEGEAEKP